MPLALAWSIDRRDNPYFHSPTLRAWVEAGTRYAARSSHADGSCDDYYPFERATGAAAFSLYAFLEAMIIVGLKGMLKSIASSSDVAFGSGCTVSGASYPITRR